MKSNHNKAQFNELIKNEMIERAILSNKAIAEGRLKSVQEVKRELKNWRSALKK